MTAPPWNARARVKTREQHAASLSALQSDAADARNVGDEHSFDTVHGSRLQPRRNGDLRTNSDCEHSHLCDPPSNPSVPDAFYSSVLSVAVQGISGFTTAVCTQCWQTALRNAHATVRNGKSPDLWFSGGIRCSPDSSTHLAERCICCQLLRTIDGSSYRWRPHGLNHLTISDNNSSHTTSQHRSHWGLLMADKKSRSDRIDELEARLRVRLHYSYASADTAVLMW